MQRARTWRELYSFPGFYAAAKLKGAFDDSDVHVVMLRRKKRPAPVRAVAARTVRSTAGADTRPGGCGRHSMLATSVNGMDEIAIRKGHDYRVVVRDLERQRLIWFGGSGRKQEDLAQFIAACGARRCAGI